MNQINQMSVQTMLMALSAIKQQVAQLENAIYHLAGIAPSPQLQPPYMPPINHPPYGQHDQRFGQNSQTPNFNLFPYVGHAYGNNNYVDITVKFPKPGMGEMNLPVRSGCVYSTTSSKEAGSNAKAFDKLLDKVLIIPEHHSKQDMVLDEIVKLMNYAGNQYILNTVGLGDPNRICSILLSKELSNEFFDFGCRLFGYDPMTAAIFHVSVEDEAIGDSKPPVSMGSQPVSQINDTDLILSLGLSGHTCNALRNAGIHTIGELRALNSEKILKIHGISINRHNEIMHAMNGHQLGFA